VAEESEANIFARRSSFIWFHRLSSSAASKSRQAAEALTRSAASQPRQTAEALIRSVAEGMDSKIFPRMWASISSHCADMAGDSELGFAVLLYPSTVGRTFIWGRKGNFDMTGFFFW
jgi:hypothetical protein